MEIKTIKNRLDDAKNFDAAVNAALAEGWRLTRRDVILPTQPNTGSTYFHTVLYAELVKLDPPAEPEPVDLVEFMLAIQAECNRFSSCEECTLQTWCDFRAPSDWRLPAEEAPTA